MTTMLLTKASLLFLILNSAYAFEDVNNVTGTQKNITNANVKNDNPLDLSKNPRLLLVLFASLSGCVWLLYITFCNSRVIGFIVTKIVNKFVIKDGESYFKLGSFSISLLNGKLMFRDVKYITKDYAIRVVDGYAIFAWWLRYVSNGTRNFQGAPGDQRDFNDNESTMNRLTFHLNGFEAHLYNRSAIYDQLHEIFKNERFGDARKSNAGVSANEDASKESNESERESHQWNWIDLIPTIKVFINSGKVALGNKLVETTFWIHCNNATALYSTSVASSAIDEYTHVIKGKCEDVRVMLSQSPGFLGTKSQPPRFMGEGFVVLQSGKVEYVYLQDVPGIIPEDSLSAPEADPIWNLNLVFTKSTTITYGPWADKQREILQKMFLPQDYQESQAIRPVQPGERRVHTGFDLKVQFRAQVTMDILFSKNDELSALHVCAEQSSAIHFFMPWTVNEFGYTSTLLVQLEKLELTTSLDFRKFLECGKMEAEVIMTVPRMWNQFQHWSFEFFFSETSLYFIHQHLSFIQDLISDWSSEVPPDIAYFVPYEWEFKFHFRDYELICIVNEHNWIDCTSDNQNGQLAFCGEVLEVSFLLPFTKFLPQTEELRFFCRAELLLLRMLLPDSNTLRRSVLSLVRSSDTRKHSNLSRMNSTLSDAEESGEPSDLKREPHDSKGPVDTDNNALSKGWRRKTDASFGWFDVSSTPVLVLNVFYKFHPLHCANESTERINRSLGIDFSNKTSANLEPDLLTVELEAGPLSIRLLGSLFRQFFVGFKENYFGESQTPFEFDALKSSKKYSAFDAPAKETAVQDARYYRPMHANITIVLLDIRAELTKHCTVGEPSPPILNMERLTFEMNRTYRETMLQLITSPATITIRDGLMRPNEHSHLSKGFLSLSGLQFRGHAFFSDVGCSLGSDTIEYAWLVEVQCGTVSGKLTLPQFQALAMWAEVFLLHFADDENSLTPTQPDIKCQHGVHQRFCKHFEAPVSQSKTEDVFRPLLCPTESELKYKMTRISVESLNVFLVEAECACNIKASPIRFSGCTSHTREFQNGRSVFINDLVVRQYVQDLSPPEEVDQLNGSSRSQSVYLLSNNWLEVGVIMFGPITGDCAICTNNPLIYNEQQAFLQKHDEFLSRLWFLWKPEKLKNKISADRSRSNICGCVGGCKFFGNNVNGVRFFTVQVLDASEMQFTRYGSESIWGGANERLGIEERLRCRSGTISLQSLRASSMKLRKTSEVTSRKGFGKFKSIIDSDSFGVNSSMSNSVPRSASFRDGMTARSSNDRPFAQEDGVSSRSRQRTESEGTFYSCESELASLNMIRSSIPDMEDAGNEDKDTTERCSLHSSMESFISAVASKDDLASFDVMDAPPQSFKPLISPALASLYGEHLRRSTCKNWKYVTPRDLNRRCSLLTNLKAISLPLRVSTSAMLPNFQHDVKGKLPFVVVNKKNCNVENEPSEVNESDDSVLFSPDGYGKNAENSGSSSQTEQRSIMNVKFHKSCDIVVTPLFLQSIERYIQSLKDQERIQHPAYVIDSLQLSCISASKNKHNQNHVLKVLALPSDSDSLASKKSILSNLFARSSLSALLNIPCVNVISLQISSEAFCSSDASSLSGQCGSKFSNDIGFSRNTCAVAMVCRVNNIKLNYIFRGEHEALNDLTVTLLKRRTVFKSSNDYYLLKDIHELTESNDVGLMGTIANISFQLQRLDCEKLSEDSSFVTAVPYAKSMVPFELYRGDDVDVDDISWLEHKLTTSVGKIMLEFGVEGIKFNGLKGTTLSSMALTDRRSPPGEEDQEYNCRGEKDRDEIEKGNPEVDSGGPSEKKAMTYDREADVGILEPSILPDCNVDELCSLLDEGEKDRIDHVVLEIQESDSEVQEAVTCARVNKKTAVGANFVITNETDGTVEESNEFMLKNRIQGSMKVEKIWFNLAHPTALKILQESSDYSVNLISSIVPSICSWIPVYVALHKAIDIVAHNYSRHRCSIVAFVMGQALPDKGRLYIKHNTNSMGTERATFLQEEHSSQLIFVLRRQLVGSKLCKVEAALKDKQSVPQIDVLEKGIYALARQWNAVIIGSTRTETMFKSERRKHVVGRGVLTRRDMEILMRDGNEQFLRKKSRGKVHYGIENQKGAEPSQPMTSLEPQPTTSAGQQTDLSAKSAISRASPESARSLLGNQSSIGSTSEAEYFSKSKKKNELNLYDWLSASNSPRQKSSISEENITQPYLVHSDFDQVKASSKSQANVGDRRKIPVTSQMVSMPTSGMQLENAREIFKCIFDALGLMSSEKRPYCGEDSISGNCQLSQLKVHIVSSEESNDEDEMHSRSTFGKGSTALMLKDLKVLGYAIKSEELGQISAHPSGIELSGKIPKETKIDISFGDVTQIVNIALIRLIMQICETIDFVKEENRFAQKVKSLEAVAFPNTRRESFCEKRFSNDELHKGWATMFNVLQLYTNNKMTADDYAPSDFLKETASVGINVTEPFENTCDTHQERRTAVSVTKQPFTVDTVIVTLRLSKVHLQAYISGMDFDTEFSNLNGSYLKTVNYQQTRSESRQLPNSTSMSLHLDKANLVLNESFNSAQGHQQNKKQYSHFVDTTIASCEINKSHILLSSKPSAEMKAMQKVYAVLGAIEFNVPQHPGILRTITTRFSKRLEKHVIEIDHYRTARRAFKVHSNEGAVNEEGSIQGSLFSDDVTWSLRGSLNSISLAAVLLPSLRVVYKTGEITANCQAGLKASYLVKMPKHGLYFESMATGSAEGSESSTSIDFPPIAVKGEYIIDASSHTKPSEYSSKFRQLEEIKTSSYLRSVVDVGHLEQNLTTDLLNQLIFLQKGFIKEVTQVMHDVDENEPVPFWRGASKESLADESIAVPLLYSIQINLKGIQITATTTSSTAVRLHTGIVALEVSNRSPNKENKSQIPKRGSYMKLFGRAEVDLMVSLGQYNEVTNAEGDNDFQSFAYFKTRIGLTNTLQDKPILHHSEDKETVIITINRPHVFVMPMAVDKGLLVYLHYKNAYDHWVEQTLEVQKAAQHILNRLPQRPQAEKLYGSLFLQLNVDKLGLSIPLSENASPVVGNRSPFAATPDPACSALIATVQETSIMCCSSGSFVSQGLFRNFCLRFANDFDSTAEEWVFPEEDIINTCSIPEGTYSVCSRTVTQAQSESLQGDKWLMTIFWRMCGVEMHFDSNIGKWLSTLSNSLTSFVGDLDVADLSSVNEADNDADLSDAFFDDDDYDYDESDGVLKQCEPLASPSSDTHYHLLEKQLWRQTKKIRKLRQIPASDEILNRELRILHDIENAVSVEFRKDVRNRLRGSNRKSGYFDLVQSPGFMRRPGRTPVKSPANKAFARRHSSVERYLETKEHDGYLPKYMEASNERSLDFVDGNLIEVAEFRSHPNLSDHELDSKSDALDKAAKENKLGVERKKDYLTPVVTKVTFSDSTYDIRSDKGSVSSQKQQTIPNMLDFQLDVVVDIDSGKCVLHSDKDYDGDSQLRENHSKGDLRKTSDIGFAATTGQLRRDRSSTSESSQKGFPRRSKPSLFSQPQNTHASEDTILLLPGVNVRVHYQSKTTSERTVKAQFSSSSTTGGSFISSDSADVTDNLSTSSNSWRSGSKSASLHAWLNIQQLPREMILLPSLLEFIDKALAPITLTDQNIDEKNDTDYISSEDIGNETESMLSSSISDHSSFPVNVVVFINIQPSDIRFSCSPVSKVECLLRIPSLDFVISSTTSPNNSSKSPQIPKKGKQQTGSNKFKPGNNELSSEADVGGFSITACLSRFSFCIFHPYGKQYGNTSERGFVDSGLFLGRRKKRGPVPQPISGRKDSLSLNVEFIKFNLFRKRIQVSSSTSAKVKRSLSSESPDVKTEVQVSITCDIGSAAFNYDMRRLNEILDVPKAWYKRDLYRRMFLGKSGVYVRESAQKSHMSESGSSPASSTVNSAQSNSMKYQRENDSTTLGKQKSFKKPQGHRRTISGGSFLGNIMGSPGGLFLPRASASVGSRADILHRSFDTRNAYGTNLTVPKQYELQVDSVDGPSPTSKERTVPEWQNKVLIAINLSRLDVSTNMGNIMGQSVWSTTDLQAQSMMVISNVGIKSTNVVVTVRQGSFDALGGIVGGYIDVNDIYAKGFFRDNLGEDPSHRASVTVRSIETRLDYMGSCILMATLSGFTFEINDKWLFSKQQDERSSDEDQFFTYKDSSPRSSPMDVRTEIKVDGNISWNKLKIVMSRSTTPDLIKMVGKLQDFFNQQQRSGMHAFATKRSLTTASSLPITRSISRSGIRRGITPDEPIPDTQNDGLKYQHWVEILNAIPGLDLMNVQKSFLDKSVILGGSLVLKAKSVLLSCFHGSNFRAQTWALFSINEPVVRFQSEVFSVEKSCQIERAFSKQEISIKLGFGEERKESSENVDFMATIRKVSRGRYNPPSLGASVVDWLTYVTSTNDSSSSPDESGKSLSKSSSLKRVSFVPKVKYENESDIVFGMPCIELCLKNEHDQPMTTRLSKALSKHARLTISPWLSTVPSPHVVESSFESDFHDGLCVTMDVSLLFFLHDLILTYMKEKDAVAAASSQSGRSYRGNKASEKEDQGPLENIDGKGISQGDNQTKKEKYRQFRSKIWKLEPKIRLLGWVGTKVDTVNIDWVLDKLGFVHAALTIPKWIQRGAMDPMDIVLSILLRRLLAEMQIVQAADN